MTIKMRTGSAGGDTPQENGTLQPGMPQPHGTQTTTSVPTTINHMSNSPHAPSDNPPSSTDLSQISVSLEQSNGSSPSPPSVSNAVTEASGKFLNYFFLIYVII